MNVEKSKYRNTVEFTIKGKTALFSNILTRQGGEKITYDIPTYEVIKQICKQIYWKPTIIWYVDSVRVMNPIQHYSTGVRLANPADMSKADIANYIYLYNVEYQVRAHFEWNLFRDELKNDRNENKHWDMAKRYIERGGRFPAFLGVSECACEIEPCVFGEGVGYYDSYGEIDYGFMYHGLTYPDEAAFDFEKGCLTRNFWNAKMNNGIINYCRPEECKKSFVKKKKAKKFSDNRTDNYNECYCAD